MVKPKLARIMFAVAVGAVMLLIGCLPEIGLPGEDEVQTPVPDETQEQAVQTPGVTSDQVLFGQSVDFGEIGTSLQIGIEAAFNEINSRGGVNGRKLSLITLDDDYDPAKALRNTDRFIEDDQVFAILGSAGTPTVRAVLPIATEAGVPVIAAYTGAEFLRDGAPDNVVNLRASYKQETQAVIDYLIDRRGVTRIGLLYQDDAFGRSGYAGARQALRVHDMEPVAVGLYTANTNAIKSALLDIVPAHPEAVLLIGTFEPAVTMIKWANRTGLHTQFYTVSVAGNRRLLEQLGGGGAGVYATQVMPLVTEQTEQIVVTFENALRAYDENAEANFYSLEGYIAGRLAAVGIAACRLELNRECFLRSLQNAQLLNIDGFRLQFGENDNQGSDAVYLTVIGADGAYHPVETLVESAS